MTYREIHDPIAAALASAAESVERQRAAAREERAKLDAAWAAAREEFVVALGRLEAAVAPARVRLEGRADVEIDINNLRCGHAAYLILTYPNGERQGGLLVKKLCWVAAGWYLDGDVTPSPSDLESILVRSLSSISIYEEIEQARRGPAVTSLATSKQQAVVVYDPAKLSGSTKAALVVLGLAGLAAPVAMMVLL